MGEQAETKGAGREVRAFPFLPGAPDKGQGGPFRLDSAGMGNGPSSERRLAAILAADVVGYSRLMGQDERGTLDRLKEHRRQAIDPVIAAHHGRIVKTTGDGLLVEFQSVIASAESALAIQRLMAERELHVPEEIRMRLRIGINLGDIIFEDGDVFGDGVNIASRLEGIAVPGGICISDVVHQAISDRIREPFRDMGSQRIKNISRPIRAWQWSPDIPGSRHDAGEVALRQRIRFAKASDGTQIAWAEIGQGRPVLKAPNWMNHLEYEWKSPVWGPIFSELARHCKLVRFDQRGTGLSDWEVADMSFDAMIADMAMVTQSASLEKFALLGISQGSASSIRFATQFPERVNGLILVGGFLRGRLKRPDPEQTKLYEALTNLIRVGWGSPNPVFRHFFTSNFIPDAPPEIASSFDELQRVAVSTENALRLWEMNAHVDVTELARGLAVPTLVLHCKGDRIAPLEEGRHIARTIPGANIVELPGNDHIPLAGTPAYDQVFDELKVFLDHLEN